MFGRTKAAEPQPATVTSTDRVGGKGRPTPTRRQAEQRNRKPLVGPPVKANATKEEKRAAKKARREVMNAERAATRQAMFTGDERALPARDRGPARRWTRNYVDSRRNAGEYFLPIALVSVVATLVNIPVATLVAKGLLYGMVLIVAVDSYLLKRRVQRLATERFGEAAAAGTGTYGLLRSLQIRRSRLPRPQVKRGETPA